MFPETRDHPKLSVSLIMRRPFSTSGASCLIRTRSLRSNRSYLRSPHASARRSSPGYAASVFYVRCFTSTLEPALCARKKERTDNETHSTAERIRSQSFHMRILNQSVKTDSLQSSSVHSRGFRIVAQHPLRSEVTANNALQRTAPGCHGSCYSRSGVSPSVHLFTSSGAPSASHLRSYRASPPRSLSLESLAAPTRRPTKRHPACHANSKPTTQ